MPVSKPGPTPLCPSPACSSEAHTPPQFDSLCAISSTGIPPSPRALGSVCGSSTGIGGSGGPLWRRRRSAIAPKRPSTTAATPPTVPPAIAPTFGLDLRGTFRDIMVSRAGSLQPLAGAFLVEPPSLLLSDWFLLLSCFRNQITHLPPISLITSGGISYVPLLGVNSSVHADVLTSNRNAAFALSSQVILSK